MQRDSSLFQLFLIKYRRLPLGKIGTVVLEQEPAFHEYTSQVIRPVKEVLRFSPKADSALQDKFEEFAQLKGVDKNRVTALFDQIKTQLDKSKQALLSGVGTLQIENNIYKLVGEDLSDVYLPPVSAGAVIHEGDVHEVKVGEQIHTSDEMKEILSGKKGNDYWWIYALVLILVAIVAMLYYVYGGQLR
ncbi:hypothetical protein [Arachidicoccus terrestris]|uniref:hypothetical protein n=1 Tax=Arachidicoccus terrestris TaxID=2875539 RepID=UPI001CC550AC|nr:hypothetical protein [Arachidicoccus terrestris]UAY54004.1 hypothetical protein K9M52_11025 [Arachidicoccus terrestris]